MILTSLKNPASHHDRSVACHVSAIQRDADISRRHLSGYHNRQCSDDHNNDDADDRG
jgi:hypothetical protein